MGDQELEFARYFLLLSSTRRSQTAKQAEMSSKRQSVLRKVPQPYLSEQVNDILFNSNIEDESARRLALFPIRQQV